MHRDVIVDAATGLRLPIDDGTRHVRHEVYEFWPNDLRTLFEKAGVPRRSPPPFLPGTSAEVVSRSGTSPRITSPSNGSRILLASATTIPLRAGVDSSVREVYWFADKTFIGKAEPREVLSWKATPGDYELTALDDHGRAGTCSVTVR